MPAADSPRRQSVHPCSNEGSAAFRGAASPLVEADGAELVGIDPESLERLCARLAVCGDRESFENETKENPRLLWAEDWDEADFFIAPTQMNCDHSLPGETIATIERFGVPLGVVKDRRGITRPWLSRRPQ